MPDILGTHVPKERGVTKATLWRRHGSSATLWLIFVVIAALIALGALYLLPQYL